MRKAYLFTTLLNKIIEHMAYDYKLYMYPSRMCNNHLYHFQNEDPPVHQRKFSSAQNLCVSVWNITPIYSKGLQ